MASKRQQESGADKRKRKKLRDDARASLSSKSMCEGPDGHPTLFGDVATGLGGAVRKNRAGDDGFHIKIYLFTQGLTPTVPSK